LLLFIPLSVLFFLLLTKPYSTYFNEISKWIYNLTKVIFTSGLEFPHDESRDIAQDINLASERLKEAVERGDFTKAARISS
jgi:two-component system, OmpR family, sensor histidine kinase VanS